MGLHSNIGPSSASRWTACPGSVALCADIPNPPSKYAAEGTAAHTLGEQLLNKQLDKKQLYRMVGQTVMVEGFEIEITEEMAEAVSLYYDTIRNDAEALRAAGNSLIGLEVEKRLVARSIDEHLFGTTDAVLYAGPEVLKVYDFKYGKGVPVEVTGNKQMMIYGIAAMGHWPNATRKEVELVIIQPRAPHADGPVRRWVVSVESLRRTAAELKTAVAATREPNAPLVAGSHCRWCAAKTECPTIYEGVQKAAAADFSVAPSEEVSGVVASPAANMPMDRMLKVLEWKETVQRLFEDIEAKIKAELEAGREVPGYKLVEGEGHRKWIDEGTVEAEFGPLIGDKLYARKMVTPAVLEKIVGKGKLGHLTFKPKTGKTLARVTDPRPATITSAQEDFGGLIANDKSPLKAEDETLAGLV